MYVIECICNLKRVYMLISWSKHSTSHKNYNPKNWGSPDASKRCEIYQNTSGNDRSMHGEPSGEESGKMCQETITWHEHETTSGVRHSRRKSEARWKYGTPDVLHMASRLSLSWHRFTCVGRSPIPTCTRSVGIEEQLPMPLCIGRDDAFFQLLSLFFGNHGTFFSSDSIYVEYNYKINNSLEIPNFSLQN